jgi:hypothetical protein
VLRRLPPRDQALDALALQQGVVDAVAGLLELPIGDGERRALRQGGTVRGSAYALYLEARGHLQRFERVENLESAISILQQALEQDASYALAYAALGEAYWRLYELEKRPELVALARENCQKALGLNDLLAPVHVTLGMIHKGTGEQEKALRARPRPAQPGGLPRDGEGPGVARANTGGGSGVSPCAAAATVRLGDSQLSRRPPPRGESIRRGRGRVPACGCARA